MNVRAEGYVALDGEDGTDNVPEVRGTSCAFQALECEDICLCIKSFLRHRQRLIKLSCSMSFPAG